MPIYNKPVRELMKDAADALGATPDHPVSRKAVVDWFERHYPEIKKATVSAHLLKMSTNAPSRVHYSVRPDGSDDLLFRIDAQHFRRYNPGSDPTPIYERQPDETDDTGDDPRTEAEQSAFAYERDLRNYLSKNMTAIEPGLRLYEEEEIKGIEFPVHGFGSRIKGGVRTLDSPRALEYGTMMRFLGWHRKKRVNRESNSHHANPEPLRHNGSQPTPMKT